MKKINEMLALSSKTAVVTGGSRGIGFGIASRLAEAGANVVIASINEEEVSKAVKTLSDNGWSAKGLVADVSKEEDVLNMRKFAIDNFGGVDILVNNAGIFPSMPIANMTIEDFKKVISVNLEGVFLCTKYFSEEMIKKGNGGKIINVTSIDAIHPSSIGLAHYDASKHGVWGFTKNSALELAPHKIWVNAVAPGGIATPGVAEMQGGGADKTIDMSKFLEAFLNKIPMHRMGEPDDIAKVALFLASDMSSYMTGSQIVVDGGFLLS
ncbi:MAG: SDR family NAD(P)-dependent oxidoreductase [Candidatus Peregrinibacteria bacterium]|nr:SDR family NAD(P)-dependent oxidoreductase [Candidatus Peregrinibacteria bacterium]